MRYLRSIAVTLVVFTQAISCYAETLEDAWRIALTTDQSLQAVRTQTSAAQAEFAAAKSNRLPIVGIDSAVSEKLNREGPNLPTVHTIVKNRLTQYMGPASAYSAVLATIDSQVNQLIKNNPEYFAFDSVKDGIAEVRNFGTTGVVAFARGQSFMDLSAGRHNISGRRVQVKEDYRLNSVAAIQKLYDRI